MRMRRDAATPTPQVLNNLFKHTSMQLAFPLNMLALVDGQPQTLPSKPSSALRRLPPRHRPAARKFDLGLQARARATSSRA
jgi:hypothetical protein